MEGPGFSWEKWDKFVDKRLTRVAGKDSAKPAQSPTTEDGRPPQQQSVVGSIDEVLAETDTILKAARLVLEEQD
jgi:hypothetical protein